MRMMMIARIPVEIGNEAIKDGTLPKVIQQTLERIKPEAAYFTTMDGERTMVAVFDMQAVSDMPPIAEPLFMNLDAAVDFMPCMSADDLKGSLSHMG
jgi:hypothetical protein